MRVFRAVETLEGAGVKVRRYIGTQGLREYDPFLLLDEIKSYDPDDYMAGFPEHPHRGFQTLTYLVKGRLRHRDSTGLEEVLEGGQLQLMNAGRGVVHSEMPVGGEGFWGFQLWLNNPRRLKMSEPFYLSYRAEEVPTDGGVMVMNLAGEPYSRKAFYPLIYLHISLPKGSSYSLDIPSDSNTFVLVSDGRVRLGEVDIEGQHIALTDSEVLHITALENSELLLGSAKPLGERVVRWGPFVMSTQEEIRKAMEDFGIY